MRTGLLFAFVLLSLAVNPCALAGAEGWSEAAEIRHDDKVVLTYRARWDGDMLSVRGEIQPGWHTFVMDNKQRQQEKLAGKPSLGIEKSTEVMVSDGLNLTGRWMQSRPADLSKPAIRWFTWGYEREAVFAAKATRNGNGPARVEVSGQACSGDVCKNIEVALSVPLSSGKQAPGAGVDFNSLVPVR